MYKLVYSIIVLLSSNLLLAQNTDVISCVQQDGSLTHRISQEEDGKFFAYVSMPVYMKTLTDAEIEVARQQFRDWDRTGPAPSDPRKIGVAIPLDTGNVYNYDIERLIKKADFFDQLFTPMASSSYIPYMFGTFAITYDKNDCIVSEVGSFLKVSCSTSVPEEINGVSIVQRSIVMSYQVNNEIKINDETDLPELMKTPVVSVGLVLKAQVNGRTTEYMSSFIYKPNGNDRQCHVRGTSINDLVEMID